MYTRAKMEFSAARTNLSPQGILLSTSATIKAIAYGMLITKK